MQIGMIGLGRMGGDMVRRLLRRQHHCVVYDHNDAAVRGLVTAGATGAEDLPSLVAALDRPRVLWLMLPAAAVDGVLEQLRPLVQDGDIVVDGGNSHYRDDIARAARFAEHAIHYIDAGVSGGVHGLERGYCLMIGGDHQPVARLAPLFRALAPELGDIPRTAGRDGQPAPGEAGYLHCGPAGAGHFVKMVHNGIEYGLMAAYAEGLNILKHADAGMHNRQDNAETAPLRNPDAYRYRFDLASIAELWRRGSVVSSWLLDLAATALARDQQLDGYAGRVSDSGEGRWTSIAAIESGAPAPVLTTALYQRFDSRGEEDFADRVLSAMRYGFGGHHEQQ
jgi:6-phosphogluconate dehydrogenase